MFGYYLNLAIRSFRRNKVLTALMVLTIALGIGACMTTLTVFHVLSGDPLPGKSDRLFYVQLDPAPAADYTPGEEPEEQLTRFDAETLLREARGSRQAVMSGGQLIVDPAAPGQTPFFTDARYTSADFFAMFDAPLLYGRGWTREDDDARARVAVIDRATNDRVFGGEDSTGRTLRLGTSEFRVVGVLDAWRPVPKFYDLTFGRFGATESVFVPFSTSRDLQMGTSGNTNCWASNEDSYALNAPCAWLQYWVELDSAAQAGDFKAYLDNYSAQQKAAGRFERDPNTRLRNVTQWLDFKRVVPSDVRLQVWLALGFLLVCLVNTVGLLLAKFLRRGGEIGVRRALGAPRVEIFKQCLIEAGTIGLAGGVLGLGIAMLGLWAVRQQPASYAKLAQLDLSMLGMTFVLALVASLIAGLLPAWRAMQITPAVQLKSQ
ncbi:ABC transporter permease [Luteimonas sp. BDR2-5]|uniref:ABC transporter permease n=1 Tax=Proluteimonas luteida TaxID=2878685 RepID=UPI001E641FE5|nr:ABC transporter permease [Luteimonas sp. BDR2-5]MCD9029924.1 ABC transporter permease [Luteimonas sp. BDR2-5]